MRFWHALGLHKDACRDARGTAWFGDLLRDGRFALRSFRRTPLVAATIVVTVGLGLGLVTAVFTFLNGVVFRADEVRDPHSLFAIAREPSDTAAAERFTRPLYDQFVRETSMFAGAFAQTSLDAWIEGERMKGALTTGTFFDVLGVNAAFGRTFTPADDQAGGPPLIVLSHRAWSRYFSNDASVLGRTVQVNQVPFRVIGVMPEGFRGLTVEPLDFWAPLSLAGDFPHFSAREPNTIPLTVVGRLAPGTSVTQATTALRRWDEQRASERGAVRPISTLVLEPRTGTIQQPLDALIVVTPLFFAFGLVLLIGCANVANLLFARSVARQREIGIRLAMGASRRRVVRQLLTESLVLALASAAVGLLVSRLALSAIVHAVTSTFPPEFGDIRLSLPQTDWRVALFAVGCAIAATMFFALAPALQATRVGLVQAIRGDVTRGGRPRRARHALIALQVASSALLLTCAVVFLRSTLAAAAIEPGIRIADTIAIAVGDEHRRDAALDALRTDPRIHAFAASWPGGLGGADAIAEGASGKAPVKYQFVSPEYFDVLGIDVVRGRGFTSAERTAAGSVAVVSETVARRLWPGVEAVGQTVSVEPRVQNGNAPARSSRTAVVVGVTRDVAGFGLGDLLPAGAGVYLPIDTNTPHASLVARARSDADGVRRGLVNRLASLDPNATEITTLQTLVNGIAYFLAIPFWLTLVLGTLALVLTVSGLFSVLSYLVEQRTREIGVRLALGATRWRISMLVLSQTARPVGVGLLVGSGLTGALGAALLATPAAELVGSTVRVFDPVAYVVSVLYIAGVCVCAALIPARRAGRLEPLSALKKE